jgi:glycine cleavage system H lipoate-binding protein
MQDSQKRVGKSKAPQVFNLSEQLCLWAQAGVVAPRLCHNAFDCISCSFDKAMQRKKNYGWYAAGLEQPLAESGLWTEERWRRLPAHERKCRHMLSGWVSSMYCINGFQCASCEYDQLWDERALAAPSDPAPTHDVAGFTVADGYYYHDGHTWARVEYGGRVRVGLDDFASCLFGRADEFRLPDLGQAVRGGGLELAFSRQGHLARAVCPVEGVVVARNPEALKAGDCVADSPYQGGWLLLLEPARLQRDVLALHQGENSLEWMERESQRLSDLITATTGQRLAATGGHAVRDIYAVAPDLGWDRLVKEFLQP